MHGWSDGHLESRAHALQSNSKTSDHKRHKTGMRRSVDRCQIKGAARDMALSRTSFALSFKGTENVSRNQHVYVVAVSFGSNRKAISRSWTVHEKLIGFAGDYGLGGDETRTRIH